VGHARFGLPCNRLLNLSLAGPYDKAGSFGLAFRRGCPMDGTGSKLPVAHFRERVLDRASAAVLEFAA